LLVWRLRLASGGFLLWALASPLAPQQSLLLLFLFWLRAAAPHVPFPPLPTEPAPRGPPDCPAVVDVAALAARFWPWRRALRLLFAFFYPASAVFPVPSRCRRSESLRSGPFFGRGRHVLRLSGAPWPWLLAPRVSAGGCRRFLLVGNCARAFVAALSLSGLHGCRPPLPALLVDRPLVCFHCSAALAGPFHWVPLVRNWLSRTRSRRTRPLSECLPMQASRGLCLACWAVILLFPVAVGPAYALQPVSDVSILLPWWGLRFAPAADRPIARLARIRRASRPLRRGVGVAVQFCWRVVRRGPRRAGRERVQRQPGRGHAA